MSQSRKDIRSILLIGLFITLIVISNLPTSNHSNFLSNNTENSFSHKIDDENLPLTSSLNLTEFITGDGVNQTVRAYMNNKSSTVNNQNGMFEIKAPTSNTNLSYGDFKFNFDSNFTTSHIVEDDNALYPSSSYFEEYRFNPDYSNLNTNEGTEDPGNNFVDVTDGDDQTYWNITSSGNGIVNVTIVANFSGVAGTDFEFDRENIIALILNFTFGIDEDADVTVFMKDFYQDVYTNVTNTINIKSSLGAQDIDKLIINKNLNFINASDCALIQFVFENTTTTDFTVSFIEFDLNSFMVLELPITDSKNLALEFDLQGANSTINGCYIWIRTLDLTKAATTVLNITLYRANATIDRYSADIDNNNLINPDISGGKIYSTEIVGYNGDELTYFGFDSSQTNNLERFNYFIVIKSDKPDSDIYSLVTLPSDQYGDGADASDHQLKNGTVVSDTWDLAFSDISLRATAQDKLDASQFKLNVTRGYMPSDFKNSLKIQDKLVLDYPLTYSHEPILTWGLGYWTNNFSNPIGSNPSNDFQIYLTWNSTTTSIKNFKFDVNYTVEAFRTENATTMYYAKYDQEPQWIFNYTLNLDNSRYDTWNFTKIMFIYQDYFTAQNLIIPDFTQALNQTDGGGETPFREDEESVFTENPIYKKVIISTPRIVNLSEESKYSGIYSLNLTSYNAILDNNMHSFINYDGTLWETQGFMYGDNISIMLDIQDHNGLAPPNANSFANISLFYPNGTLLSYIYSSSGSTSIDGTRLMYDFYNNTILDVTNIIPLEEDLSLPNQKKNHYSLGYFWTNGSEIGCNKIPIYIDAYKINLSDLTYDRSVGKNSLLGSTLNNVLDDFEYSLLIGSINETSNLYNPDFYTVNNSEIDTEFTYKPWASDFPYTVLLKSFLQNETVLNPEEDINIKVSIENLFQLAPLDVKISVKFVSLANEEWIIDEKESDTKILNLFGNQGATKDFNVTLSIPQYNSDLTWKGQNAPIRQGGVKSIVSIYIEDNLVGTYESDDYSLIVNSTDDVFEGYIIALKNSSPGNSIGQYFERDECIYLPNKTSFVINIYDKNYVSIYSQIVSRFELNLDSNFTNILFPSEIKQGEVFNITSTLITELGEILPNKLVFLQYERNGIWVNTSTPQLTGANGETNFEVNTLNLDILGTTPFKLSWAGDVDYLNNSNIFQVPIEVALNDLSLSSEDDKSFLYNNRKSTIELKIKNRGNSTLRIDIDDIDVDISEDFDYEIIGKDEIVLNPGESEIIQIEIEVGNIGFEEDVEVRVEIKAVNILTNEIIQVDKTFDLDIIDTPLNDYIIKYFLFIMIAIFALMLFIAYYYSRHIKKKIELSSKEVSETRQRRGKYVKVSELKAAREEKLEEPTEEIEEIKPKKEIMEEEVLEAEKKTVDLDTLLEEEDLKKGDISKVPPEKKPKDKKKSKKIKEKPVKPEKVKRKEKKLEKGKPKKPEPIHVEPKKTKRKEKKLKKGEPKKPEPIHVEPKKVDAKKTEPKKTTDLDTLLEEKGLKEDKEPKKVPKKVSEPEKKIKKSSPKPLSTRQMVQKKRGKKKSRKKKR